MREHRLHACDPSVECARTQTGTYPVKLTGASPHYPSDECTRVPPWSRIRNTHTTPTARHVRMLRPIVKKKRRRKKKTLQKPNDNAPHLDRHSIGPMVPRPFKDEESGRISTRLARLPFARLGVLPRAIDRSWGVHIYARWRCAEPCTKISTRQSPKELGDAPQQRVVDVVEPRFS
jgi:hypothetical protein